MHIRILLFAGACLAATASGLHANVPAGFDDTEVASGLSQPAGIAFAPDGRLFVAEKTGALRVVKDGALLATPFLDLGQVVEPGVRFDDYLERGLLGVAFDLGFPDTPFVYIYYSVCRVPETFQCSVSNNRVARVTAGYQGDPDRADPASHVVLLDNIDSESGNHNAGWLGFGPRDGKLYVSVGDGGSNPAGAQDLGSLNGKVLRLEPDGTVPFDNPFVGLLEARPEIWALGFRNPWRCRFHPDGRLFCGDVGAAAWEEIDWVVPGGNYGWPITEGDFDPGAYPQFVRPIHAYDRSVGTSISVGDFGSETSFPSDYQQSFFFGDYSWQWIRRAVLGADGVTVVSVTDFAAPTRGITDLVAGPDGALYYTNIVDGTIRRIAATNANTPPVARASAVPSQGQAPLVVQFSSAGSTDADGDSLSFLWDFGDGSTPTTEPEPVHPYAASGFYHATLTVSDGRSPTPGSDSVTVPVTVGTPPVVTIEQPVAGFLYRAGETIALAGSATDAEDGALDPSQMHWEIRFHHDTHWHPFLADLPGSPRSFDTATSGETSATVSYRILLRATDSSGLTGEASLYLFPRTAMIRLDTSPPGLQLTLDGQPVTAPLNVTGVVGMMRTIGAPSPQGANTFAGWSDGGVQIHTFTTPVSDTTYRATFDGPTTTTMPVTTTTSPSTTVTTSSTTSATSSSTTSTSSSTPPPTSSSTAPPATTSTTTAPTTSTSPTSTTSSTSSPSTTTTSSSSSPSSSSTSSSSTTSPPATTTSTTLALTCAPALTPESLGCRMAELGAQLAAMSSDLGRLGPGLARRLDRAIAGVKRAAVFCEADRLPRARAALGTALRRVQTILAKLRSHAGREAIPTQETSQLDQLLVTAVTDLKALRRGLVCP